MILIENLTSLLPTRVGKIVGVASYRGDYILVACEHGLFKLWDDGTGPVLAETTPPSHP